MKDMLCVENFIGLLLAIFSLSLYYNFYLEPRDTFLSEVKDCMDLDRSYTAYEKCVQIRR